MSYEDESRARLLRIIEKKMKTTFIGAISEFETYFGDLWGHGKSEDKLSDEELKMRRLWNNARNGILTNGNNQVRAIKKELSEYTIKWNPYKTEFRARKSDEV